MFLERDMCLCDPTYVLEASLGMSVLPDESCAAATEGALCTTIHAGLTAVFMTLFAIIILQTIRFWFFVSDKFTVNINLMYLTFLGVCFFRFLRYALLALDFEVPHAVLHALFYAPFLLAFSSLTILIPTWMDLFFTVSGKGQGTAAKLPTTAVVANILVLILSGVCFYFDVRLTPIPIALGSLATVFLFFTKCFRKFKNAKYSRSSSRSTDFPRVTYLTAFAALALLGLVILVSGLGIMGHWFNTHSFFFTRHVLWIIAEVAYIVLQLITINSLSFVSILPLPSSMSALTPEWLTTVLREKGAIHYTNSVVSINGQKMRGGCHSKVHKFEVTYADKSDWAPKALVVKILTWDSSLWTKIELLVRSTIGGPLLNRQTDYLKSYSLESQFYKNMAPIIHGIQIPKVYYNYEDTFNNQFGLVMQDVTAAENGIPPISGQPDGFTFEECKLILSRLAKFHAWFWKHKDLDKYPGWQPGGFWTGDKRMKEKRTVAASWKTVLNNFGSHLTIRQKCLNLGDLIEKHLDEISQIHNEEPRTLLHGDFKISNLFIEAADEQQVHASGDLHNMKHHRNALASQPNKPNKISKTDVGTPTLYTIDWQWMGQGIGATDAGYFLCTSTLPEIVNRRSMKKLAKVYHAKLVQKGVKDYPFPVMWRQIRLVVIDFVLYLIVCKWVKMTMDDLLKYKEKCKDGLPMRSLAHMQRLIELATEFMEELELH